MMEADVIVSVAAAVATLSVGALIWTLNRLWERMEIRMRSSSAK